MKNGRHKYPAGTIIPKVPTSPNSWKPSDVTSFNTEREHMSVRALPFLGGHSRDLRLNGRGGLDISRRSFNCLRVDVNCTFPIRRAISLIVSLPFHLTVQSLRLNSDVKPSRSTRNSHPGPLIHRHIHSCLR